jgi:hypothetical protein
MTEFKQELGHYCRNPKCRSKLPEPVANEREAFCARGCHSGFYRKRCLVCEAPMERRTERQLVCGKRKCRNALQTGIGFGRYHAPSSLVSSLETPTKPGIKSGDAGGRGWRIIAGPELTPNQLHCATVPDGADCQWKGGEYERIEKRNRAALAARFDQLDHVADQLDRVALDFCAACGRADDLVDHKMTADRWVTICRDCLAKRLIGIRARAPVDDDHKRWS